MKKKVCLFEQHLNKLKDPVKGKDIKNGLKKLSSNQIDYNRTIENNNSKSRIYSPF